MPAARSSCVARPRARARPRTPQTPQQPRPSSLLTLARPISTISSSDLASSLRGLSVLSVQASNRQLTMTEKALILLAGSSISFTLSFQPAPTTLQLQRHINLCNFGRLRASTGDSDDDPLADAREGMADAFSALDSLSADDFDDYMPSASLDGFFGSAENLELSAKQFGDMQAEVSFSILRFFMSEKSLIVFRQARVKRRRWPLRRNVRLAGHVLGRGRG